MYSLALIIFVVSEKKAFEHFPIGSNDLQCCFWAVVFFFSLDLAFFVHLDHTWHPSSVVCKLFTFQASSPKALGQLEPNLKGMFLGRQGGTVVVDRTFNLGHFFVTTFAYKNHPVVKDTKDPPIFIGPLLLHKDASYRTYYSFFTYIVTEIKLELRIPFVKPS
jgi:hypothetical protein